MAYSLPRIIQDKKYPQLYRVRLTDGTLSDILNLPRAKELLKYLQGELNGRK